MADGGITNGSGVNGGAMWLTLENRPELLQELQEAMDKNLEVKVLFHREIFTLCRSAQKSNNGFITNVEIVHPQVKEIPVRVEDNNSMSQKDKDLRDLGALILRLQQE